MREGSADKILEKMLDRKQKVSGLIGKQLKSTKPFAQEPLSPVMKIWAVDNLGIQDMQELCQEFGNDAMNYVLSEVNKLRRK